MNKKIKFALSNILKVGLSNVFTIISGIVVGFLLPKLIGITNYGYYKTFVLYITYSGLFQFGISEGILLKYGGVDYEELDKKVFRSYSQSFIIIEFITSLILIIFSMVFLDGEYSFIFVCVAMFILFQNVTTYYQYISQITNRFNELSIRNVIKSILTILTILGMLLYSYIYNRKVISYRIYTIIYIIINSILMFWYIYTYREITFGEKEASNKESSIFLLAKFGLPLLLSSICGTLILNIDRQFVNMYFDIDTYGAYAFAYSIISLITTATSSIGTVIYPQAKRTNEISLISKYQSLSKLLIAFVMACGCIYFPLCKFMSIFFINQVKYLDSLPIFRVLLPGLSISCTISLITQTYYKTFNLNKSYFRLIIIILFITIITDSIAYYAFNSTLAISIASVIVFVIWYVIANQYLKIKIGIKWENSLVYVIIEMIMFYITSLCKTWWLGLIIYSVLFILTSLIMLKNDVRLIFFENKGEK